MPWAVTYVVLEQVEVDIRPRRNFVELPGLDQRPGLGQHLIPIVRIIGVAQPGDQCRDHACACKRGPGQRWRQPEGVAIAAV